MIDTDKYEGLTNDGKWIGTDADDSVIYYDAERDWYATIALVQRDSDHYGSEDNPDIRLMVDAPLLLAEVKRLSEELKQTRECLWWCYDLKRFGDEIKDEHWDFIGRLLGADTDHNDNEWSEEE